MYHIVIFFIVLLIFLHIRKHRITSNDMEILMFNGTKNNLEIMCEFKQPILFQINSEDELIKKCNHDSLDKEYDMNLIKEEGFLPFFETNFLQPSSICYPNYSIILSSFKNYVYHISHRQYYLVSQGSATINLITPNQTKMVSSDYYEMSFLCEEPIIEKILPITLTKGDCLFIPPNWGYKILMEEKSSLLSFNYKIPLNIISYLDYYILHFFQKINTIYKYPLTAKKIEIDLDKKE